MYHIMYTVNRGRRFVWGDFTSKSDASAALSECRAKASRSAHDFYLVENVAKAQIKMVSQPVETFDK